MDAHLVGWKRGAPMPTFLSMVVVGVGVGGGVESLLHRSWIFITVEMVSYTSPIGTVTIPQKHVFPMRRIGGIVTWGGGSQASSGDYGRDGVVWVSVSLSGDAGLYKSDRDSAGH